MTAVVVGPFESQVNTLAEGVDVVAFTRKMIDQLRDDYFAIMRNLPRVETQSQLEQLRWGIVRFRKHLDAYFDKAEGFGHGAFISAAEDFCYKHFSSHEAKLAIDWRVGDVRKAAWNLSTNLDIPYDPQNIRGYRSLYNTRPRVSTMSEEPPLLDEKKIKNYRQRVGKLAKELFDRLNFFLEWSSQYGEISIVRPVERQVELSGFKVVLFGYDPDTPYYSKSEKKQRDGYLMLVEALKMFRERASRLYPRVLDVMLPLYVSFDCELSDGGRYDGRLIRVCPMGYESPNEVCHVVAHEMGHHLHRLLSRDAQRWWSSALLADTEHLDLDRLLRMWGSEKFLSQLHDKAKESDPALYLQLQTIFMWSGTRGEYKDLNTREDVEKALATGRVVSLPKHPITAYADKNHEESFCEVFGLWLTYGPRTLHPMVLSNIKYVLGV